jgi:hypothetical protein
VSLRGRDIVLPLLFILSEAKNLRFFLFSKVTKAAPL